MQFYYFYTEIMKKAGTHIIRKYLGYAAIFLASAAILLFATLLVSYQVIRVSSKNYLYDSLDEIPFNNVAVVLGTSHLLARGGPNPYFSFRMEAAALLYHSGKVNYLIVSGDNRPRWYNEPEQMRRSLVALGVPDSVIYLDYAGLRTLDSVVRSREIFGQESFTIVSQRFHNQRAVYIAQRHNLNATAFNARDVSYGRNLRTHVREWFARVKVFWDLLIKKQPRFLGEEVIIGEKNP